MKRCVNCRKFVSISAVRVACLQLISGTVLPELPAHLQLLPEAPHHVAAVATALAVDTCHAQNVQQLLNLAGTLLSRTVARLLRHQRVRHQLIGRLHQALGVRRRRIAIRSP